MVVGFFWKTNKRYFGNTSGEILRYFWGYFWGYFWDILGDISEDISLEFCEEILVKYFGDVSGIFQGICLWSFLGKFQLIYSKVASTRPVYY